MATLILKVEVDEDKITSILSRLDDIRKDLDRLAYDANAALRGTITEEHFEASEGSIKKKGMTKFEMTKSITDVKTFSEFMFDLVGHTKNPEEMTKLLSEELTEEGLESFRKLAQTNYPLSLDLRQ